MTTMKAQEAILDVLKEDIMTKKEVLAACLLNRPIHDIHPSPPDLDDRTRKTFEKLKTIISPLIDFGAELSREGCDRFVFTLDDHRIFTTFFPSSETAFIVITEKNVNVGNLERALEKPRERLLGILGLGEHASATQVLR